MAVGPLVAAELLRARQLLAGARESFWTGARRDFWLDAIASIGADLAGSADGRGFSIIRTLDMQDGRLVDTPAGSALLDLNRALMRAGVGRYR